MSISNTWEVEILDHIFNNAAAPAVAAPWISLHTADPGETGANEVTAGTKTYTRQSGAFGAAAAGAVSNSASLTWSSMPAASVKFVGVWNSSTATASASFIWGGAMTTTKVVGAGDTFKIAIGDLDVTLN
jgi:hypothetical protein